MSVTSSQVIGAGSIAGAVTILPYTAGNPLFDFFQLSLTFTVTLVAVLVFIQLLLIMVNYLRNSGVKRSKSSNLTRQSSTFISKKVLVQLSVMYLLVSTALIYPWLQTNLSDTQVAFAQEPQELIDQEANIIVGTPSRLMIPSLNLNLPVDAGEFKDGTWTLSDKKVLYATNTHRPNNTSHNTVLYGHNTARVLKPTKHIKVGDELVVQTVEHISFTYRYISDRIVEPEDTSVFSDTVKPTITLITCDGFFSSHRRVMTFELVSTKW